MKIEEDQNLRLSPDLHKHKLQDAHACMNMGRERCLGGLQYAYAHMSTGREGVREEGEPKEEADVWNGYSHKTLSKRNSLAGHQEGTNVHPLRINKLS